MIVEKWLHIDEFPRYLVSQLGNVYDYLNDRMLIQTPDRKGYLRVKIQGPYGRYTVSIHRLVAKTFYGIEATSDDEVNHRDGDKSNNCIWNLEWSTRSKNMQHAYAMGLVRMPKETRVRCVETGQEFRTMREAARFVGVSDHKSIMRVIDKPQYACRGYHFVTITEGGEAHDHF